MPSVLRSCHVRRATAFRQRSAALRWAERRLEVPLSPVPYPRG